MSRREYHPFNAEFHAKRLQHDISAAFAALARWVGAVAGALDGIARAVSDSARLVSETSECQRD